MQKKTVIQLGLSLAVLGGFIYALAQIERKPIQTPVGVSPSAVQDRRASAYAAQTAMPVQTLLNTTGVNAHLSSSNNPQAGTTDPGAPVAERAPNTVTFYPPTPNCDLRVNVDGKPQKSNSVPLTSLTNGLHTLVGSCIDTGKAISQYIIVNNPWPAAILNHVRENARWYGPGLYLGAVSLTSVWFRRPIGQYLSSTLVPRIRSRFRD